MSNLFDSASLVMIPSGYKATKLYSIKPTDGTGDFTVARASTATRWNSDLELEEMAANVPRINYPSCPSVLLEPARTNLVTYPVSFDNATYWNNQRTTVNNGYSSPSVDYPNEAFKLIPNVDTANSYQIRRTSIAVTSGATISLSIFAKAGERNWLYISEVESGAEMYVDLTTGTKGTITPDNYSIDALADGWYHISITGTVPSTNASVRFGVAEGDNDRVYDSDGVSGLYIFGAQLEEGTYPTSFIYDGTEGATVNRAADLVNGATYSGLDESGVLFAEITGLSDDGTNRRLSISDGSNDNRVSFGLSSSANRITAFVRVSSVNSAVFTSSAIVQADTNKVALRWAENDFSLWINGVKNQETLVGTTFSSGVLTVCNFTDGSGLPFYGECHELSTLPYLTDAEMASLTT